MGRVVETVKMRVKRGGTDGSLWRKETSEGDRVYGRGIGEDVGNVGLREEMATLFKVDMRNINNAKGGGSESGVVTEEVLTING